MRCSCRTFPLLLGPASSPKSFSEPRIPCLQRPHSLKKRSRLTANRISRRPVTLQNGTAIRPSAVVRRLGAFFDRNLSSKIHVDRKVVSASRALQMIGRLKNSERGLSSQHRQLYTSCVTPILDYGIEPWWGGQRGYIDKLQRLQNTACRRI